MDGQRDKNLSVWDATEEAEKHYGIPTGLLRGLGMEESHGLNHWDESGNLIKSNTGATGAFQFTKGTARQYGINRDNPLENIAAAGAYLRDNYKVLRPHLTDDKEAWIAAAIAHNRGLGAVQKMIVGGQFYPSGQDAGNGGDTLTYATRIANNWANIRDKSGATGFQNTYQPEYSQTPLESVKIGDAIPNVYPGGAPDSLTQSPYDAFDQADTQAADALKAGTLPQANLGQTAFAAPVQANPQAAQIPATQPLPNSTAPRVANRINSLADKMQAAGLAPQNQPTAEQLAEAAKVANPENLSTIEDYQKQVADYNNQIAAQKQQQSARGNQSQQNTALSADIQQASETPNDANPSVAVPVSQQGAGAAGAASIDLSQKPKGENAGRYLLRSALAQVAPQYGLNQQDVDNYIAKLDREGGQYSESFNNISDADLPKYVESLKSRFGSPNVDFSVTNDAISNIKSLRDGFDANLQAQDNAERDQARQQLIDEQRGNDISPVFNTPDYLAKTASNYVNDNLFGEYQPTDDEIEQRRAQNAELKLTPEEIETAQFKGREMLNTDAGAFAGGVVGGMGSLYNNAAGFLRPLRALGLDGGAYAALNKAGQKAAIIEQEAGKDAYLPTIEKIGGRAVVDLPKYAAAGYLGRGAGLSALAAEAVTFGADGALQSLGRGESLDKARRELSKGALNGLLFSGAGTLENIVGRETGSRILSNASRLAAVGTGSFATEIADGKTPEQAFDAAVHNVLNDAVFQYAHQTKETAMQAANKFKGKLFNVVEADPRTGEPVVTVAGFDNDGNAIKVSKDDLPDSSKLPTIVSKGLSADDLNPDSPQYQRPTIGQILKNPIKSYRQGQLRNEAIENTIYFDGGEKFVVPKDLRSEYSRLQKLENEMDDAYQEAFGNIDTDNQAAVDKAFETEAGKKFESIRNELGGENGFPGLYDKLKAREASYNNPVEESAPNKIEEVPSTANPTLSANDRPFDIRRDQSLKDLGYSDEQISNFPAQDKQRIVDNNIQANDGQPQIFYRGTHPDRQTGDDEFYSSKPSVAEEYAAPLKLGGSHGKVEEFNRQDLPQKLYETSDKENLAEDLGIETDPNSLDFDNAVKKALQSKGYEGVYYHEGTFGGAEIHKFGDNNIQAEGNNEQQTAQANENAAELQRTDESGLPANNVAEFVAERNPRNGGEINQEDGQTADVRTVLNHPNPEINGKEIIATTDSGKVVVKNEANKSGVSVVKPQEINNDGSNQESSRINDVGIADLPRDNNGEQSFKNSDIQRVASENVAQSAETRNAPPSSPQISEPSRPTLQGKSFENFFGRKQETSGADVGAAKGESGDAALRMTERNSQSAKDKYEIDWKDPDDWELNEDTDLYENIGSTKHFNISYGHDSIDYTFKDRKSNRAQTDFFDDPNININVENDRFNRLHISGIAPELQGKGYGKEIYHSLVDKLGIISSSEGSASPDVNRVWNSLINSGEYYSAKLEHLKAVSTSKERIDKFIDWAQEHFREPVEVERGYPTDNNALRKIADTKSPENAQAQTDFRNTANKADLLPQVEAKRNGSSVRLSLEAGEIARFVDSEISGQALKDTPTVEGLTLDARHPQGDQVKAFTDKLNEIANTVEQQGGDRTTLDNLSRQIEDAAKDDGTAILHVYDEAESHERTHQQSIVGARENEISKTYEQRYSTSDDLKADDDFQSFKSALEKRENRAISHGVAMEEALAYLGGGKHSEFGLEPEQAKSILKKLITGYADANGAESLKNFKLSDARDIHDTIEDLYNEKQTAGQKIAETGGRGQSDENGRDVGRERETESETTGQESGQASGNQAAGDEESGQVKKSNTPKTLRDGGIPVEDRVYTPTTNAEQQTFADDLLDKGTDAATKWLDSQLEANDPSQGKTTVVATNLMKAAAQRGDLAEMNRIADKIVPMLTEYGQAIQAMSTLSGFDPEAAPAYAAKLKKQFLGKDLTPAESARAKQVATDFSETAKAEGLAQGELERIKQVQEQAKADREAFKKALAIAEGRGEKLQINLDAARKAIRNLTAKNKRLEDAKPPKARATTQTKLLTDLKAGENDLLARLKNKFSDAALRMTGRDNPQTETPEFKKWFGESKVVDETGKPLTVYHGTKNNFHTFAGKDGFHFGTSDQANMRNAGEGNNLIPTYLRAEKLKRFRDDGDNWTKKIQQAKKQGYDGIVYLNRYEGAKIETKLKAFDNGVNLDKLSDKEFKAFAPEMSDSYIVFEPNQIKSAIGNTGEFSKDNDSILRHTAKSTASDSDLVDYATLQLLENLPKGKMSVEDFNNKINEITKNSLTPDEVAQIHSEAISRIRQAKPLTPEQRAVNQNRSEHYRAADEFAGRADKERTKIIEDAAKEMRGKAKQDIANAETASKNIVAFENNPLGADRYVQTVLDEGAKANASEAEIFAAVARKTNAPNETIGLIKKYFPDLDDVGVRNALRESSDILAKTKDAIETSRIKADNQYNGTIEDANKIKEAQKINNREKNLAKRKADQFYDSLVKSNAEIATETAGNLRKANMLTSLRRLLNDVTANSAMIGGEEIARIPASIADTIASLATGERTVQGLSVRNIAKSLKDVAVQDDVLKNLDRDSGLKAAANIMRYGTDEGALNKLQTYGESHIADKLSQATNSDTANKVFGGFGKVTDAYINTVFRSLSAGDALFKTIAFRRSLEELARVQAANELKSGKLFSRDVRARTQEILAHPPEAMQARAMDYAEYVTFQNDNKISDALSRVKNLHYGVKGVSDLVVPFDRTPTNIVLRALDYSPYGLLRAGKALRDRNNPSVKQTKAFNQKYRSAVKADTRAEYDRTVSKSETDKFNSLPPAEQRQMIADNVNKLFKQTKQQDFAKLTGRGVTGTSALALGVILAAKGLLTGSMSPNPILGDKKEADEFFRRASEGIENRSLLIPNVGRFVLPNSPQLMQLTTGATLYEQYKLARGDKDATGATIDALTSAGKDVIFEQPLLRSTADLFGSNKNAGQRVGEIANSFVPASAFLKDVSDIGDASDRRSSATKESKEQGTIPYELSGLKNAFTSRLPIVRNYAADQSDFRNPDLRGNWLRRAVRSMVDVTNARPATNYAVGEQIDAKGDAENTRYPELKALKEKRDAFRQAKDMKSAGEVGRQIAQFRKDKGLK